MAASLQPRRTAIPAKPPALAILSDESPSGEFPALGPNIRALLVWPRFPLSFWGFEGVLDMIPEKATSPPLGLITVAALCPPTWSIRLVDRAFEDLVDEDIQWADLVMISAMYAQREDARVVLACARALGRRTLIGGPWASSDPDAVLPDCDHVVVGEVEEAFAEIAAALERGVARRLYRISEKPDVSRAPVPRFDLLRLEKYSSMSVQFSRGCPFQCEFCDIITIYGRRPRTKTPAQLIAELDTLRRVGWRNEIFIVDDNFIGNSRNALQLARDLAAWQKRHGRPFSFYTEASIDLADRPELLAAMVEANFGCVFIGIESPSAEALNESRKFQNLRRDNAGQIRVIQEAGLWVLGGFIVGFDSDDETIFARQLEFIDKTAITWAMAGILQAPPTTALHARMKKEGRLIEDSQATTNFCPPNFRTVLPLPILLRGLGGLLRGLYEPASYFSRAFRSLQVWRPRPWQGPPRVPVTWIARVIAASLWRQGICSGYRCAYWTFVFRLLRNWAFHPMKLWIGFMALLSAQHFIVYSRQVADELERTCRGLEDPSASPSAVSAAAASG